MGVVFDTHELRVGSQGSCVAEESCQGDGKLFEPGPYTIYTNKTLSLGYLSPKVNLYCALTVKGGFGCA